MASAVVRRKSKVTYADIIAWLLDQCPEQVAQVEAMCPPEVRAKFLPRSGRLHGLPAADAHPASPHRRPRSPHRHPHTTPDGLDDGSGGQVGWLMPPGPGIRFPGAEGELVDCTGLAGPP